MDVSIEAALPYLESRGIMPETAETYVLTYDAEQDAILIPYMDAFGRLRGVARRYLSYEPGSRWPPKYFWPGDTARHLYNVVDADKSYVFLCEGEFDTLILKQVGLNAIGVPGVKNFKLDWAWLFADKKVCIMFDEDPPKVNIQTGKVQRPGQDAAVQVRRAIMRVTDDVEVIHLPEGEDITSVYMEHGKDGIMDVIRGRRG